MTQPLALHVSHKHINILHALYCAGPLTVDVSQSKEYNTECGDITQIYISYFLEEVLFCAIVLLSHTKYVFV